MAHMPQVNPTTPKNPKTYGFGALGVDQFRSRREGLRKPPEVGERGEETLRVVCLNLDVQDTNAPFWVAVKELKLNY